MMFKRQGRISAREQGRNDDKILGNIVGNRKCCQGSPCDQQLLPYSTTSMSLVGLLSRSTMLPASLAAAVPVFIASPTSAWANAGHRRRRRRPSRPFFPALLFPDVFELLREVSPAQEIVDPGHFGYGRPVRGLSPVTITVRIPIMRSSATRSSIPRLTTSFRWMIPSTT